MKNSCHTLGRTDVLYKDKEASMERVMREHAPLLIESGRLQSMSAVMWEPNKKIELLK